MTELTLKVSVFLLAIFSLLFLSCCSEKLEDGGLRIGWAMEDITPDSSVSLSGQYYERISQYVQSPLKVTACAFESTDTDGSKEQAIMVSFDLVGVRKNLQDTLRILVKDQMPDFNVRKLFLNATHTHSAPRLNLGNDYGRVVLDRTVKSIRTAWNNREPAGICRALGYAVVGHNRRVQYANWKTEMYGKTDREDIIGMEGPTNPGVDMLFCWDLKKNLTGIIMNVSCPAQVTEAKYYVSSDYWSEVRKQIRERFIYYYCLSW